MGEIRIFNGKTIFFWKIIIYIFLKYLWNKYIIS